MRILKYSHHGFNQLVVFSPAKLNLFLEVLGQREDGFHDLATVMVAIDFYDVLCFQETETSEIELECYSNIPIEVAKERRILPASQENLIWKAATHLQEQTDCSRGVRIQVQKRIPLGSGMGGGSSNAASTLLALNQLWDLALSVEDLHSLAAQLGSDVNFFLNSTNAALCKGRGEQVVPLQVPLDLHFVVACPSAGLSTSQVFQEFSLTDSDEVHDVADFLHRWKFHPELLGRSLFNRLEEAAVRLKPELQSLSKCLHGFPFSGKAMTGSGSTWFGLCSHHREANWLAAQIRTRKLGFAFSASCCC